MINYDKLFSSLLNYLSQFDDFLGKNKIMKNNFINQSIILFLFFSSLPINLFNYSSKFDDFGREKKINYK